MSEQPSYYTDRPIRRQEAKGEENDDASPARWDYVSPEEAPAAEEEEEALFHDLPAADVPEPVLSLWRMSRQGQGQLTRNKEFYRQALLMATYGDDTGIVPFFCYYPTYADMSITQLRSYFTLRRLIRKGVYPEASLSYLFVYIYETLMQVGIDTPGEGWDILEEIRMAYAEEHPRILKYLDAWMQDYAVYYGLTDKFDVCFGQEREEEQPDAVLANYAAESDEALFEAAAARSSYKIKASSLFKKQPAIVTTVGARLVRAIMPIYEQTFHRTADELCIGKWRSVFHPMFASAIFYNPAPVMERCVEISRRKRYTCKNGLWSLETAEGSLFSLRRELLGELLREMDCRLRLCLQVKGRLVSRMQNKEQVALVQREIDSYLREKEASERPRVAVDLSRLAGIRSDADAVRDALLVDEEEETAPGMETVTEPQPTATPAAEPLPSATPSPFTPEEQTFLRLLLSGGDWQAYLREIRVPAGVLVDAINGKMMDELQDIVIADEGDGPRVIDDYREELLNKI